ncbi:MAG: bifunctional methylenetetrahydrofolate dehydrogenase/methenyltetrahydrofolate cyclohydrolase, partial [Alphaproteobacteria bacterium]|nr:bifunctional methylenetetrahydrofolate dehydrogenase/methenyltetrahydrofolate cyclohydrolase [Alphaproteobacteria bacterium]
MTETRIIDGKGVAAGLCREVAAKVAQLSGPRPGLVVVQMGDHPASDIYVRNKIKTALDAGIRSFKRHLPATATQNELLAEIASLNLNPEVHGILVQLPLPPHIAESAVISAIAPEKDVDGFHPLNIGRLWSGEAALTPCTPLGCLMLLKQNVRSLSGRHAVIIGRSNIVGKPMAALLLRADCTVTIAHSRTQQLAEIVKQGDIVIAAVGKPELVRGSWIKPGAVIIDVGINRVPQSDGTSRLVGDVAFQECLGIASAITPVPG